MDYSNGLPIPIQDFVAILAKDMKINDKLIVAISMLKKQFYNIMKDSNYLYAARLCYKQQEELRMTEGVIKILENQKLIDIKLSGGYLCLYVKDKEYCIGNIKCMETLKNIIVYYKIKIVNSIMYDLISHDNMEGLKCIENNIQGYTRPSLVSLLSICVSYEMIKHVYEKYNDNVWFDVYNMIGSSTISRSTNITPAQSIEMIKLILELFPDDRKSLAYGVFENMCVRIRNEQVLNFFIDMCDDRRSQNIYLTIIAMIDNKIEISLQTVEKLFKKYRITKKSLQTIQGQKLLTYLFTNGNQDITNYIMDMNMYIKVNRNDRSNKGAKKMTDMANEGNINAMYNIGRWYIKGNVKGIKKNVDVGIEWLEKAANLGDARSMYILGCIDMKKIPVTSGDNMIIENDNNEKKACKWFEKAANLGDTISMYITVLAYKHGILEDENKEKQTEMTKKAMDKFTSEVMYELFSEEIIVNGKNVAIKWCKKAANAGNVNAMFELGNYYSHTSPGLLSKTSIEWYERAANEDHREAIKILIRHEQQRE